MPLLHRAPSRGRARTARAVGVLACLLFFGASPALGGGLFSKQELERLLDPTQEEDASDIDALARRLEHSKRKWDTRWNVYMFPEQTLSEHYKAGRAIVLQFRGRRYRTMPSLGNGNEDFPWTDEERFLQDALTQHKYNRYLPDLNDFWAPSYRIRIAYLGREDDFIKSPIYRLRAQMKGAKEVQVHSFFRYGEHTIFIVHFVPHGSERKRQMAVNERYTVIDVVENEDGSFYLSDYVKQDAFLKLIVPAYLNSIQAWKR